MKNRNFFGSNDVFLIAEIGNNHEGSLKNALKLVDKAAEAGVDAVKFQTYQTNLFLSNERINKSILCVMPLICGL